MNERTFDPSVQEQLFADVSAQLAAALEILRTTTPTGSGLGGNEFFNLDPGTYGVAMQIHLLNGKLLSLQLTTEAGIRWEDARQAALREEDIAWTDYK